MLQTLALPRVLDSLKRRLGELTPETSRRWGTLTAHEMLCHLGDSGEMVLRIRPRANTVPQGHRRLIKFVGLWTPMRWPHGWRTNAHQDPRRDGTKPAQFLADRDRVIRGLELLAAPGSQTLESAHGVFGRMTVADWQRWAFKHVDHHLRQFGV